LHSKIAKTGQKEDGGDERDRKGKGDKEREVAPGGLSKINSNDEQKRHVNL